jgi:CBS-domain-containing membrane protein
MGTLPGRLGTLQARDVMTDKVVILEESQTIQDAANTLIEQRISGAPVVSAEGVFVGLLSLTDLAQPRNSERDAGTAARDEAPAQNADYWETLRPPPAEAQRPPELVKHRMSRRLVSVSESTPLLDIAEIMCKGHWHRVTVVDARDRICGIVSTMDVLAALVNTADEEHS